ncbi:hypothetical protein ILUMI_22109 [Ignelater luminosus]|uniref:C-type lectin domain-containing protein n=1 Tax=Ignelater luminosus TaxID=2038154 RepID=A0A8K0CHE3_IGNLU|nr:hypothetical protein ILUMI_22109 [Ignelater luminosus]
MYLFYSIFLIHFSVVHAHDKGFHDLDIQVESYQYGDYFFNFYYVDANWDEAFAICKASASRLAVVHNMERARFLSRALSHTLVGVEDVWIGARIIKDNWEWVPIKHDLPKEIVQGYPPWLNYPTKRGKYCLSLDRKNHSEPLFVELQCSLQRPFLCEKSMSAHLTVKPTLSLQIKINMSTFYVYYGRVSWDEALTFCKQSGARLATVINTDVTHELVSIMQHMRPVIRNAWIGARRQNYGWIWTATDEIIPSEKDLDTDYPPWPSDDFRDMQYKDCLVLDHHVCKSIYVRGNTDVRTNCKEKPVFLPEGCHMKRDFICEMIPPKPRAPPNETEVIMAGSIKYVFLRQRQKWKSAVNTCRSLNMMLAMPETKEELNAIISNLADVEYAWDHIWLGAKWNIFTNNWESINKTALPVGNRSYLPWCKSMPLHEASENCLNLDRDAHKVPVVYGFNCSIPQGFVCQFVPDEAMSIADNVKSRIFVIQDYLLNYGDAEEACQVQKSHLAITNSMELAQNLSLMLPADTLVWIGGQRIDSVWQWSRTKEIIPDFPDDFNYPPWGSLTTQEGKMCLAMQSGFRKRPMFIEVPCNKKLFYVCELGPKSLPEPDLTIKHHDYLYYFYNQKEVWEKAGFFCTASHLKLPKVGNFELANYLSGINSAQNAWWIGSKREPNDKWRWINGEPLSEKIIQSSLFQANSSNDTTECLLLLNDSSITKFLGIDCKERHGFICMNYNVHSHEPLTKKHDVIVDIKQTLGSMKTGKKYCEAQGMNVMNITENLRVAKEIMQEKQIPTVWMNVIHINNGKWLYQSNRQEFRSTLKFPERDIKDVMGIRKDCAMLVLRIGGQFEIKRSECNDHSFTLCQKKTQGLTDKFTLDQVEINVADNVKLIASLEGRTFEQSKQYCLDIGAETIDKSLYKEAVQFFKTLSPDYKQFWIGEIFAAAHKAKPVAWQIGNSKQGGYQKMQKSAKAVNMCVAYNRTQNSEYNANCSEKLSTLCFLELRTCAASPNITNLKWSPQKCEHKDIQSGQVCTASCRNWMLFGPEKIVCNKGNWTYRSQPAVMPSCIGNNQQLQILLNFLKSAEIQDKSRPPPFIFALDSGIPKYIFDISISIVKHIANIIILNKRRKAALILYNKRPELALEFYGYDTCFFSEKLKYLSTTRPSAPNYVKVLSSVYSLLEFEQSYHNIVLVFFAQRKDVGSAGDRIKVLHRLQSQNVTVLILTANKQLQQISLENMASVFNNELLFYRFQSETQLRECADFLQKNKNPASDSCADMKKARP